jgi:DNA-binding NarL/FixJ family response regulator
MGDRCPAENPRSNTHHPAFRETLRDLIASTPGFTLVGLAASGEEAVAAVARLSPRLVLMDVVMPGMDGIAAARMIVRRDPRVFVVLISADDPALYVAAVELGEAVACARKQELGPKRLRRVWEAHAGSEVRAPQSSG